jgi:hypothetical protein
MMQAMQHFRDCVQLIIQCYCLFKDVNNFVVSSVHVTRIIGEASSSTPILPAYRKVLTAAEKAHVKRLPPPLHFMVQVPRGGISNRKVMLAHKSALEPAELHSLCAQRRSNHRMRSSLGAVISSIIASIMDSVTPYD